MDNDLLLTMMAVGSLLLISVLASKATSRFGIPILLIFIAVGMLSGSEGIGGINFKDAVSAQVFGTISLVFILFSGGLCTQPSVVKPIWKEGAFLASFGVVASTAFMAVIIHFVTGWDWLISALLGATISSTDAPAVFGILSTQKIELKEKIKGLIEMESASNDPMAVVLTVLIIQLILHPQSLSMPEVFMNFFIQLALGGLAGWFLGKALVSFINWLNLEFEGLYPVLTIAGALSIYSLTEFCGGNGFLSVYLAGLSMASEKFFSKKALIVFHDGVSWLMQVAMFLTLGLLVNPSELAPIAGVGITLALGLIFLARPLSVWVCLKFFPKYRSLREMWFISWGGVRGAVPIILSTYIIVQGVPHSQGIFNIVFFIVIISMLLQGFTITPMGRWTKVIADPILRHLRPQRIKNRANKFMEFEIQDNSSLVGQTLIDLKLPDDVLVVLIHRKEKDFIPRGNTEIRPRDRLVCLVNKKLVRKLNQIFQGHLIRQIEGP